ncbi:MAG: hypothetical protein ACLRTQ_02055 [Candidatus Borkfalkia sp.]
MNKSQRRQIEREFYNYKNNKQMAAEYVASHALDGFAVDYSRERVQSTSDNGNENKILFRIDKAEYLWKWCLVYEKTYERFIWTGKEKIDGSKICPRRGLENDMYRIDLVTPKYILPLASRHLGDCLLMGKKVWIILAITKLL